MKPRARAARRDAGPRPRLELPFELADRLAEAVALAGWLTLLAVTVAVWPVLPSRVPLHFDAAGNPDGWGSPGMLALVPALGSLLYLGLTAAGRFPHLYNYPYPITAANAARQYRLARRLLAVLKAVVVWLFVGMVWGTASVATGRSATLPPGLLFGSLLAIAATLVVYFVAARRAR